MATTSEGRPEARGEGRITADARTRVTHVDIGAFGERLLDGFKPGQKRSRNVARRVVAFLMHHPKVRTTKDLIAPGLIEELEAELEHLSPKTMILYLEHFRRACNLAVRWGWLRRSPFDDRPIGRLPVGGPRGIKLDRDQVRRIVEAAEEGAATYEGMRLATFIHLLLYADLGPGRAAALTVDGGEVRLPDGPAGGSMPVELATKLKAWLPMRGSGKPRHRVHSGNLAFGERLSDDGRSTIPDEAELAVLGDMHRMRREGWGGKRIAAYLNANGVRSKQGRAWTSSTVCSVLGRTARSGQAAPGPGECRGPGRSRYIGYGERFADDGVTRIPDDAERRVLDDIRRWRAEGWGSTRIASELNARGVPTKRGGAEWYPSTVRNLWKLDDQAKAGEDAGAPAAGREGEPDWLFPSLLGRGHWPIQAAAHDQIRALGERLGIDGLTFESLVRFRSEATAPSRPALNLWQDRRGQPPAEAPPVARECPAEKRPDPSPWDAWDRSICPVHIRDDGHLVVFGRDKGPVRKKSARELFGAVSARYPGGFTLNELEKLRIATDFRGIMSRWREKDDDCREAIQLPKTKHGGLYRFGPPD